MDKCETLEQQAYEILHKALDEVGHQKKLVVYSMHNYLKPDILNKIALEGKIQFIADSGTPVDMEKIKDFFGEDLTEEKLEILIDEPKKEYESKIIENPTWLDVLICANEMIIQTKDYSHRYLENLNYFKKTEDNILIYEFEMGS